MTPTYDILKSRTFWTLVVAGVIPVIDLFVPLLSPSTQAVVGVVLLAVANYFHVAGVQNFGKKVASSQV